MLAWLLPDIVCRTTRGEQQIFQKTGGSIRSSGVTLLLVACLIGACEPDSSVTTHARTILALGTIIEIEIIGTDRHRAEQALAEVELLLQEIQHDWYAFGDGELGQANKALELGHSVEVSPELAALVRRSLQLRKLSDGFFDPTIGGLVELWGFDAAEKAPRMPPSHAAISRWIERQPARNSLRIDNLTVSADGPLKLDFGGIAKGTTLARVSRRLQKLKIDNAIINAGGDLIVLGTRGQRKWRVGIRDPRSNGVLGAVILAPGESIVTSGNYERFFRVDEELYHHLLDPRTGQPVTDTASVTVVDFDPELADAAATALMAAGPRRFRKIARQMGIVCAMLVTTDGEILLTERMAERIDNTGADRETPPHARDINKTVNHGEFQDLSRV